MGVGGQVGGRKRRVEECVPERAGGSGESTVKEAGAISIRLKSTRRMSSDDTILYEVPIRLQV